ncbi:MAG: Exodeoxyribonuclease 7 small subunit [Parcubacteria group bacterium Gr01-1014_38]|nr:MAG: Exodeoxyribonuclease 7 small subunit [Parcubacteria group bacterium Gr01-1014_38]
MAKETSNFTRAYEELEKIVASFEAGDIDLERDLPKFERGMKLASQCRERLKAIENHIQRIEKTFHVESASERSHSRTSLEEPPAA